jgi:hypothetical protein
MAHEKARQVKEFRDRLEAVLGHPVVGPQARAVLDGQAPPAAAPPPPGPTQTDRERQIEQATRAAIQRGVPPERIRHLFEAYHDPKKADIQAFGDLVTGLLDITTEVLVRDPRFLDRTFQHSQRRQAAEHQIDRQIQEVEGFWAKEAPDIPLELFWSFDGAATRLHPGDPVEQAVYCLHQATAAMEPYRQRHAGVRTHQNAINRTQDLLLGGSTGAPPPAGPSGGGEPASTMADQLRAARARRL